MSREHALTVSIGLAEAELDDDPASLLKRADSALYSAKEAGRARARGRQNQNTLPSPWRDCTPIRPPIASARRRWLRTSWRAPSIHSRSRRRARFSI